ncbi:MAG: aminomethyl-transferring glycine dehydrogenase [bacterium]|nr:aminomethyl-transferring glycine dehydrogenase [bacterium]
MSLIANNPSRNPLQNTDHYERRHIGPGAADVEAMLQTIGVESIEALIEQTVPASIRSQSELKLDAALSEQDYLKSVAAIAAENKIFRSYLGLGYSDCITPSVILRNVFENPGWYTQYTPYQAEIAQGRLEALLNFQTVVMDLTGMEIANASLLDESTAAAEAMAMLHRLRTPARRAANTFFLDHNSLPQTIEVVQARAEPLNIDVKLGDPAAAAAAGDDVFAVLLQYPDRHGLVLNPVDVTAALRAKEIRVVFAADLLALCVLKSPGEFGADVVVGNSQRFGVPMGYGGPHAAYFATRDEFKRSMPGRLIGVSVDRHNRPAYRLALQTREQHIRREKATSNICTAQALLAIMASMYAVYHGPDGLKAIAERVHLAARSLEESLAKFGLKQSNAAYFDTLRLAVSSEQSAAIRKEALAAEINLRYIEADADGRPSIVIALDETVTPEDLAALVGVFERALNKGAGEISVQSIEDLAIGVYEKYTGGIESRIPAGLQRTSAYLDHAVFHAHRSETRMMRYIRSLEQKDLALNTAMIPLGSCTMKLNAATTMIPVSWPAFARIHPFVPLDQVAGYRRIFTELENDLSEITGFAATSLQPNSGAQGEYAGLMVIRAYQRSQGQGSRDVALIPTSAHGTNPASATMAGLNVVLVKCDDQGNIDVPDLKAKAAQYSERLCCLMITYPSTHGVFEETIEAICRDIHEQGGQVYMDGANMNAQVGLTSPGRIGADVCHLNLHKTFSIPHGGGGPGMGPICVAKHLAPFLPGHSLAEDLGTDSSIPAIAGAPYGSASILLISYAYIKMLGQRGVLEATKYAILNANYLKTRLADAYDVLYTGKNGRVAHEMILDIRPFKKLAGIEVEDVAKRLIDYGFHAPTMSWPVPGTLMVEPTESEPKEELDRFCEAMLRIRAEIQAIADKKADAADNVLKNAPHTAVEVSADEWTHAYTRGEAAYPVAGLRNEKFWAPVGRIDNAYGDRNLVCACPPLEDYADFEADAQAQPELAAR